MDINVCCPDCGARFAVEDASDALLRSVRADVAERERAVSEAEAELTNERRALEDARAYLARVEALVAKVTP
jgi:predicted  nucleic acid-binding Zn-ribbon protein